MTRLRPNRSLTTPPMSRKSTSGIVSAVSTAPTSVADPWCNASTANDNATGVMPVPMADVSWPMK